MSILQTAITRNTSGTIITAKGKNFMTKAVPAAVMESEKNNEVKK